MTYFEKIKQIMTFRFFIVLEAVSLLDYLL